MCSKVCKSAAASTSICARVKRTGAMTRDWRSTDGARAGAGEVSEAVTAREQTAEHCGQEARFAVQEARFAALEARFVNRRA
jgi:hypothetical protein